MATAQSPSCLPGNLFGKGQTPAPPTTTKAELQLIQRAALQAVNFHPGDAEALKRVRTSFTTEGWQVFMKWIPGFLDKKGAPTFTSNFVPSGNSVVIGNQKGVIPLQILGTLI
jgi:hypothetical protein